MGLAETAFSLRAVAPSISIINPHWKQGLRVKTSTLAEIVASLIPNSRFRRARIVLSFALGRGGVTEVKTVSDGGLRGSDRIDGSR